MDAKDALTLCKWSEERITSLETQLAAARAREAAAQLKLFLHQRRDVEQKERCDQLEKKVQQLNSELQALHQTRQVDTNDADRIQQFTATVDGEWKFAKTTKSSGLLSRRGGNLALSMKMPCVDKQASPFTLLEDRYKILEKLGSGCASVVHRAVHLESCREVALKIPRTKDPARTEAAQQEYDLLKRLTPHPNIIKVFDFHNLQGEATLVLELFDGVSLQAAVQEKELMAETTARSLCIPLFNAVAHLHAHSIIHRDIKPQNILVSRCLQNLRLIDFNVAACLDDGAPLTPTGTKLYKAPELLLGELPCERSDVWACGLCVFFMLSGSLPQGREDTGLAQEVACTSALFDASCWQHVSEECQEMLQRCLDNNREQRPLMAELLDYECMQLKCNKARLALMEAENDSLRTLQNSLLSMRPPGGGGVPAEMQLQSLLQYTQELEALLDTCTLGSGVSFSPLSRHSLSGKSQSTLSLSLASEKHHQGDFLHGSGEEDIPLKSRLSKLQLERHTKDSISNASTSVGTRSVQSTGEDAAPSAFLFHHSVSLQSSPQGKDGSLKKKVDQRVRFRPQLHMHRDRSASPPRASKRLSSSRRSSSKERLRRASKESESSWQLPDFTLSDWYG